jgi:hypothetical protein
MKMIVLMIIFSSCSGLNVFKTSRSDKYLHCVINLNDSGINQTLIREICIDAYGSKLY